MPSSRSIWTISCLALLFTLGIAGGADISTARAEEISDPNAWRESFGEQLSKRSENEALAFVIAASKGRLQTQVASVAMAQLTAFTDSGDWKFDKFLIEKRYNEALSNVWRVVVVGETSLFYRCSLMKFDDGWRLMDLDFNTDPEKISLP
jgi:hypothetical protein